MMPGMAAKEEPPMAPPLPKLETAKAVSAAEMIIEAMLNAESENADEADSASAVAAVETGEGGDKAADADAALLAVPLAATAAAACAHSHPSQKGASLGDRSFRAVPLEDVKAVTRGCYALANEVSSSQASRARAAPRRFICFKIAASDGAKCPGEPLRLPFVMRFAACRCEREKARGSMEERGEFSN